MLAERVKKTGFSGLLLLLLFESELFVVMTHYRYLLVEFKFIAVVKK